MFTASTSKEYNYKGCKLSPSRRVLSLDIPGIVLAACWEYMPQTPPVAIFSGTYQLALVGQRLLGIELVLDHPYHAISLYSLTWGLREAQQG